ncbi:MAG: hypothetical protein NTZ97_04990 [Candidatus Moranbacteria bacterium]|nr:hypothetical protein [Candidatus Moranbacteria bacterium]
MRRILKIIFKSILILLTFLVLFFIYFNWPVGKIREDVKMGVTFSSRYASDIGLNWRENYLALLDDLKIRKIRIPVYWDLAEPEENKFNFSDIDWQLSEARKRNAEIILVVGQKVPRWPECFVPSWVGLDETKRKERLLDFLNVVVERYKNNPEIKYWQVENEPFLKFGNCPALDKNLLDSEILLVKKLDPERKIIITDSGELSFWIQAAKRADVFGTTMYRQIYKKGVGQFTYPIGPRFFHFKYWLIQTFAKQNQAIVVELQGEPWLNDWTTNVPVADQLKVMNGRQLEANVIYAKKVALPEVYLWGVEWWYWLKVEKNQSELWDKAREIFSYENQP